MPGLSKSVNGMNASLVGLLQEYELENVNHHVHLVKGDGHVIPKLAHQQQIDLIVMGTVCRTGIAGVFIGNTAESILPAGGYRSVLTVKPDGFVSPVPNGRC